MYANIGTPPNACWNTLGRVIKMRLGPESGCMPTEKAAGKVGRFAEIRGVRTKTSHSQA